MTPRNAPDDSPASRVPRLAPVEWFVLYLVAAFGFILALTWEARAW